MLFQNPYSQLMTQLPQPTPGPFTMSRPAALGPANPSALPTGPLMMAPPQPVAGPEQGPPPPLLPPPPQMPRNDPMLDTMNLAANVKRGGLSDLSLMDYFQRPQQGLFGMNNIDLGLGSMATPTLPVGLPSMGLESMATPTMAPTPVSDGGFTNWLSNLFGGF